MWDNGYIYSYCSLFESYGVTSVVAKLLLLFSCLSHFELERKEELKNIWYKRKGKFFVLTHYMFSYDMGFPFFV